MIGRKWVEGSEVEKIGWGLFVKSLNVILTFYFEVLGGIIVFEGLRVCRLFS